MELPVQPVVNQHLTNNFLLCIWCKKDTANQNVSDVACSILEFSCGHKGHKKCGLEEYMKNRKVKLKIGCYERCESKKELLSFINAADGDLRLYLQKERFFNKIEIVMFVVIGILFAGSASLPLVFKFALHDVDPPVYLVAFVVAFISFVSFKTAHDATKKLKKNTQLLGRVTVGE